jgi:hypothetical protein
VQLASSSAVGVLAAFLGIDTEGLIKTEEQIPQEMQQAQLQQMMMQAGPDAINEGVKQLGNANEQQQAQE